MQRPNLGSGESIRCVEGGGWMSGLWHSRALTFLQGDCSSKKSELSVVGARDQGLTYVSSHSGAALVVQSTGALQAESQSSTLSNVYQVSTNRITEAF